MTIDKGGESILITSFGRHICCYKCQETQLKLIRIRENGKKIKPAKYVCEICFKKE